VASYEAIKRTLRLDPEETVVLGDDESARQFVWWQQAKHQARAGDEMCEAAKRYFAARAGNASVIAIPGVGRIERKAVQVKAEVQPRPARTDVRWTFIEE